MVDKCSLPGIEELLAMTEEEQNKVITACLSSRIERYIIDTNKFFNELEAEIEATKIGEEPLYWCALPEPPKEEEESDQKYGGEGIW